MAKCCFRGSSNKCCGRSEDVLVTFCVSWATTLKFLDISMMFYGFQYNFMDPTELNLLFTTTVLSRELRVTP